MKILDASTIIAVFNEINCPELIDKIIQLGHDLAIPSHVMNSELLDKSTLKIANRFIQQDKIQILNQISHPQHHRQLQHHHFHQQ